MSELVLFRTTKQKQGDRKRAEKLRGRRKGKGKLIVKGVVGAGLILGGRVALKHYKNKNAVNVTTGTPKLLEPTKYPVVNIPKRK